MKRIGILLLSVFFNLEIFGQDTTHIESDTVILYKDPLVVKKTVYYSDPVLPSNKWWFQLGGGPLYTINYFGSCSDWDFYLNKIKSSTSPLLSYSFNGNLLFLHKNFIVSGGINFTSTQEKFTADSSGSNNNKYVQLMFPLTFGYRILNTNKIQILPSTGMSYGYLFTPEGNTYSEELTPVKADLKDTRKYYSSTYQFVFKTNISYKMSEGLYIGAEPTYFVDIRSITQNLEPVSHFRNMLGLNLNLLLKLK